MASKERALYQGLVSTEHFSLTDVTEMFEENKIRNLPNLVCKILMSIWNILLVSKRGLQPYAQPVSGMNIASLQHAKN